MNLLEHTIIQYACILKNHPGNKYHPVAGPLSPYLFHHSIVSMPAAPIEKIISKRDFTTIYIDYLYNELTYDRRLVVLVER